MNSPSDPDAHKIGTVFNLDGEEVTVTVKENLVCTDKPLELQPDQWAVLMFQFAKAGWQAGEYDGAMASADGGGE